MFFRVLAQELADASSNEKNLINLMLIDARCGLTEPARKLIDELGAPQMRNGELHLQRARALAQLTRHVPEDARPMLVAEALSALERAAREGFADPFRVRSEPDLVPLKSDPRFSDVLARFGNNL